MPSPELSGNYDGIILDATALINCLYLGDWDWLKKHYVPLYIAQELLDSDNLEPTRSWAESRLGVTRQCLRTLVLKHRAS